MTLQYSPKNNPRVIVIQKLYGKYFNEDENLTFPKHRFKKFIKDVVKGTIERDEVINCIIAIRRSCRRTAGKKSGRFSSMFSALDR